MARWRWLLTALFVFPAVLIAQAPQPKVIDVHVHYNGDPAFLQKLTAKLDAVDGMALLITAPKDLTVVSKPSMRTASRRRPGSS